MNHSLTALERQVLSQYALRDLAGKCSDGNEIAVLSFILDRTINWGKIKECIPFNHFLDGIGDWRPGLPMSRRTLIRVLHRLLDAGVIQRAESAFGFVYNLVFDMARIKRPTTEKGQQAVARTRRRTRPVNTQSSAPDAQEQTHTEGANLAPLDPKSGCQSDTYKKGNEELRERKDNGATAPTPSLRNRMSEICDGVLAKMQAQRAKRNQTRKAADYSGAWLDAVREHHPGAPVTAWTKADFGKFKPVAAALHGGDHDPHDFLRWVAQDWLTIRATVFRWMDRAPETPALGLVVKFRQDVLDAYYRRSRLHEEATETRHQRYRRSLMKRGYSFEEADRISAEKLDTAVRAKALDERERRLAEIEDTLSDRERRVATQRSNSGAPVDPVAALQQSRQRIRDRRPPALPKVDRPDWLPEWGEE